MTTIYLIGFRYASLLSLLYKRTVVHDVRTLVTDSGSCLKCMSMRDPRRRCALRRPPPPFIGVDDDGVLVPMKILNDPFRNTALLLLLLLPVEVVCGGL